MGEFRDQLVYSQRVFQGRAIRLKVDTVQKAGGRETTREVVEHSDCVAILAIDAEDNLLLVRQFRHAVARDLLEIPAGSVETGETPDEAVCRELREETGYLPNQIKRLGGFYSSPGYCTEYLHLYLATDLVLSPLQADDTEDIEVVRVPSANVGSLIASGTVCDAKSIAGLLSLSLFRWPLAWDGTRL